MGVRAPEEQGYKATILTDTEIEFVIKYLPLFFNKPMGDKICYPTY